MQLNKLVGIVVIISGLMISFVYFNILSGMIGGIDIVIVGVWIFILHEIQALIASLFHEGNKIVGIGIPFLFILISAYYLLHEYLPIVDKPSIMLIISALMFAEGLYRLH